MKKNIKIEKPVLAIETSQSLCGVCLYFADDNYFESNIFQKNIHAEKLFELINSVLQNAEVKVNELDAIAVSSGPGSFTGLRIGMSAAKGIAFGSSLPIVPIPTFEALALQISNYYEEGAAFIIANKVNMEEVYYAKFKVKDNNYMFIDDLTIISKSDLEEKMSISNLDYFGNAKTENLSGNGLKHQKIIAPDPFFIAKWSKLFGKELLTYNYEYLEPTYIKKFIVKER